MGKYADMLAALGSADAEWKIESFNRLVFEITELETAMGKLVDDPGWTGESAEAARQKFWDLKLKFSDKQAKLAEATQAIEAANQLRLAAASKHADLPDGGIPWYIDAGLHGLEAGSIVAVPGIGKFVADVVVQKVTEFFGAQREAAALNELHNLEQQLVEPRKQLMANRISVTGAQHDEELPPRPPDWPGDPIVWDGDSTGSGGWSTGGGGGGGFTGGAPNPPIKLPPQPPPGWPHVTPPPPPPPPPPPTVSVDGNVGGSLSGGGFGAGGVGAGLAGAGVLAAGSKLASGGTTGSALLGGGGAAGGAGAGAGAGAKNSAMMGGGHGGGASNSKNKRNSLGLMAPKLEDDDVPKTKSKGAQAGGRE
jgi:hypothetical protein